MRAASIRLMSASAIVVQVAAVCSDCTIREPIAWRMRESGWPPALGPVRRRLCLRHLLDALQARLAACA